MCRAACILSTHAITMFWNYILTSSAAKVVALIGVEGPSTVMRHCGLYVLLLCLGLIDSL